MTPVGIAPAVDSAYPLQDEDATGFKAAIEAVEVARSSKAVFEARVEKIKEQEAAKERKARVQPQLPIPEPLQQVTPTTGTDGENMGIVSVEFEL